MSKRGKNGREVKKKPLPKQVKGPKPQGLVAQIIADQKRGLGIPARQKNQDPPRVTKLYLMFR